MLHMARVGRVADAAQRFGLILMVGALLTALWAALIVFFSVQHARLLEQASRDLRLVNTAVAQHAEGLFRAIETDLRTLDLWLRAHPDIDPLTDPAFTALVAEMSRSSRGLIDLRIVDRDGNLYTLPWVPGRQPAQVGDRDYVLAHDDVHSPRAVFVGNPVQSRVTGHWSIPVSWRLEQPTTRFTLVTCVVQLDRLFEIHDRLRYQPDGTISFVRRDGVLLSRTPFDPRFLGRDMRSIQNFADDVETGANGTFTSKGMMTDGIARFGTYERLTGVPVTVVVSRSLAEVMEPYNVRLRAVVSTCALITLGVVAFTAFLHRSQRALRHAQRELQRLATTDELTGTCNRRAFSDIAEREFLRAKRFDRPMTLLALDIDHFKLINDRHGHAVGDRVLKVCAERWGKLLREQDLLGRLGGEEFCVLLPETPPAIALAVAERLRAATVATHTADGVRVTVSIGVSSLGPDDEDWADTLERADHALYVAKDEGRDRVALAG